MPQIVVNKEFKALIKDMDKQKDKSIKCGTQHSQTVTCHIKLTMRKELKQKR